MAKGQRKPPHRRERYFGDGSNAAEAKKVTKWKAGTAAQGSGLKAAGGLGDVAQGLGLAAREAGGGEAETDWSAWGKDSADDEGRGKGEERREEGLVEEGEVEDDEEGEDGVDAETRGRMGKYSRGKALKTEKFPGRLKAKMEHREKVIGQGVLTAAQAEKWLLPSEAGYVEAEGVERTSNVSQADIVQHVGAASRRAAFDLKLPELGPYKAAYSLNGRSLLLGGRKGHLAVVDWRRCHVTTEIQVRETVHDVCFLHNEQFFATAQKRYTFIYDKRGIELHCLKHCTTTPCSLAHMLLFPPLPSSLLFLNLPSSSLLFPTSSIIFPPLSSSSFLFSLLPSLPSSSLLFPRTLLLPPLSSSSLIFPRPSSSHHFPPLSSSMFSHPPQNITGSGALRLQYLPHHMLLASISKGGVLDYVDTTTGRHVAQCKTRKGRCDAITADSRTGVISLGHSNGTVSLWSPSMGTPLATLLAHHAPLTAIASDASSGRYLVTAGMEGRVRVWDVRTLRELHSYVSPTPARTVALSQRDMLAVGFGSAVEVWKEALTAKQHTPYLKLRIQSSGANRNTRSGGGGGAAATFAGTTAAAAVERLSFCPYEDVLGTGHAEGFSSLLVPGAGEANFDSFVANPFETGKQRREAEIHMLLDKLPPESIMRDPDRIGTLLRPHDRQRTLTNALVSKANAAARAKSLGKSPGGERKGGGKEGGEGAGGGGGGGGGGGEEEGDEEDEEEGEEEGKDGAKRPREKNKTKGRNKPSKRAKKRKMNIIESKREATRRDVRAKEGGGGGAGGGGEEGKSAVPLALARFQRKGAREGVA
ncbi:unnamed protein product [Closterium sp. NIES-64]|nr:unnamed protein product [Closterium sp. NIES-64]